MELKLQRNLVLQELSILQGVVEHRTTIPILSSILAETAEARLRMVATDLDMTIMTDCPAVVHGGGRLMHVYVGAKQALRAPSGMV